MNNFKKSMVTTAVLYGLSMSVAAEETVTKELVEVTKNTENDVTDTQIEKISVIGKGSIFSRNYAGEKQKKFQSSASSVMGLIDQLPGVSIEEGDAFGGDDYSSSVSMRGFTINESQSQLGITIDGIPNGGSSYNTGSKANRYLDSENTIFVDVSQGTADVSSASLQALGGTLNFISDDPADEKGARIGITTGDFNARRTFLRYDTGEIGSDTYAYFSISDTYTDRWIGSGSNGHSKREHYEFKIISEFDNVAVSARLSHDDAYEINYNGISSADFKVDDSNDRLTWDWSGDPDKDQNYADTWSTLRKNTLAYAKIEWQISDDTMLHVAPYYHKLSGLGGWAPPYQVAATDNNGNPTHEGGTSEQFRYLDVDGQPCFEDCGGDDQTRVMSIRHTNYAKTRYGTTVKIEHRMDNHEITGALWLQRTDRDENRSWHNVIDPSLYYFYDNTPYWTQYNDNYITDSTKISIQDKIHFDGITINLGIAKYLVSLNKTDNYLKEKVTDINSDSDILPSAGFLFDVTDGLEIFGGYSENFSAIGDQSIKNTGTNLDNLKPETATNTDLGLRYQNGGLFLSTTVYHIKFDNKATFIAAGSAIGGIDYLSAVNGSIINDGGIISQGIEASMSLDFSENWNIYSSLTYNSSEYSENLKEPEVEGNTVAGALKKMAVVSLSYDDGLYRAGISGKYTGARYGDKLNTDLLSSYTVLDIYVGYNKSLDGDLFKELDIGMVINNITDKRYLGGGIESYYFIGAPRTATVNLTVSF